MLYFFFPKRWCSVNFFSIWCFCRMQWRINFFVFSQLSCSLASGKLCTVPLALKVSCCYCQGLALCHVSTCLDLLALHSGHCLLQTQLWLLWKKSHLQAEVPDSPISFFLEEEYIIGTKSWSLCQNKVPLLSL